MIFSPDDATLLTGGGRYLQLWDTRTGKPTGEIMTHDKIVESVVFGNDGQSVLSVDGGANLHRWTLKGTPLAKPVSLGEELRSASFSPDGRALLAFVSVGDRFVFKLHDLRSSRTFELPNPKEVKWARSVFRDDGQVVATKSDDGIVRLWNVATGQLLGQTEARDSVILAMAFHPDGRTMALTTSRNEVIFWDTEKFTKINALSGEAIVFETAAFSRDGKFLVALCSDNSARLWDFPALRPSGRPYRHLGRIATAVISPDGATLLTAGNDYTGKLWAVEGAAMDGILVPTAGEVTAASLAANGDHVLVGMLDGQSFLHDLAKNNVAAGPWRGSDPSPVSVARLSPNDRTSVIGDENGHLTFRSAPGGELIATHSDFRRRLCRVNFSDDSRFTAAVNHDGMVGVFETSTGKPIAQPFRLEAGIASMDFGSEGLLVIGGKRRTDPCARPRQRGPIRSGHGKYRGAG